MSEGRESRYRSRQSLEQTRLANERTLLAYLRTALALVAGGAVVLRIFRGNDLLFWIAWGLIAAGLIVMLVGGYRFVRVKQHIRMSDKDA